MVKHEIKVELDNSDVIKNIIEKVYFEEGYSGKIITKKHFLTIGEEDDVNWSIFKGLNGATVRITNDSVIDGAMRFMIDETNGDIRLYPISIYCIKEIETDKYIFY